MKKSYCLLIAFLFFAAADAQVINFPDANFKAKLLSPNTAFAGLTSLLIDANSDGEIEVSEAQQVRGLNVSNSNISDMTGISFFTNLEWLNCSNNLIQSLVISTPIALRNLNAGYNALSFVEVQFDGSSTQPTIDLSHNNLTSYTVPPGVIYNVVKLNHNQLDNLIMSDLTIAYLYAEFNNLTSIEASQVVVLKNSVNFSNNHFSLLDLSNIIFGSQSTLILGNNVVDHVLFGDYGVANVSYSSVNTFLDLGNFSGSKNCSPLIAGNLTIQDCPNLNYISLKNGFAHNYVTCSEGGNTILVPTLDMSIVNCPNLSLICVDETERTRIQAEINSLGLQNQTQVNDYCTFVPGGTYFTFEGSTRFDYNGDGCDAADSVAPWQKFTVSNGTSSTTITGSHLGTHFIDVGSGSHTFTPNIENPIYFNVIPTSSTINFPNQSSPFTQDFCITANGNHPDLEIIIIPVGSARPGLDCRYNIIYKNKGSVTLSGQMNLQFNDTVLDFVSSNPSVLSQTANLLVFDFEALEPFQAAQFAVTFNANSPTETPALNGGDVLHFTASIVSAEVDETPDDNTFALHQTVVNSFDPNDKTCLEGNNITPEMVGKYVHYMIRFENTGTANAENIVVKDMIDTTKFDVSSLIPLDGSHEFVTRINSNKVEFIFENINLPFDDANNDGYVAFKIKTNPTLVLGDTFSNTASIYFDYNFPIVTEPAVTAITALVMQDFVFDSYFRIYPNPASDVLKIESKQNIVVQSISIYNTLGQLVLVVPNARGTKTVDVSGLNTGNYFIKIDSDKGTSNAKFIKS